MSGVQPAWARAVIARRMAGNHPARLNLVVGRDWSLARAYWDARKVAKREPAQSDMPWLALNRDQLGAEMDLRVVAGCAVWVHWQAPVPAWDDEAEPFFGLLRALAGQASWVFLKPELAGAATACGLAGIFLLLRKRWPAWWSDEIEREHGARQRQWTEYILRSEHARAA